MKARKTMKNCRILILFLTLIFSISLLVSCGNNGEDISASQDSSSDTSEETATENNETLLFSQGVCNYRIVYPSDDTDAEFNAARKLQSLLEEKSGVKPEMVRSSSVSGENADPAVYEILLSFVDFDEFHDAISAVGYNYYAVAAMGNKIVVTAHEREYFNIAFEAFTAYIEENTADGKLVIPNDLFLTGKVGNKDIKSFYDIPGYPGGMIEDFSLLGNSYTQVTIYDTDAEMYETYGDRLETNGYSLYSENEIDGNFYSTYTKGEEIIYYYYCSNSGDARVIIAEDINLPSLEMPEYTKICEPAYISLAIYDENGKVSGDAQGAIIRFEDGSFMIYDGGDKNSYQAKQIYETLLAYAPDPNNITVRAWVFSHFHSDHTGAFQKYAATYKSKKTITIESFIYNFCNTEEQTQTISTGQMTNTDTAVKAFKDAVVYKCLTGQVFHFPGMDMEVLATMSDFIPQVIGFEAADAEKDKGDGNTMTVVLRLKTLDEGNTCMLTGDATNIVLDDMVDRYSKEYLTSDIVTTPHHAHNRNSYRARNATIKFYSAVQPKILVVTSSNYNKFIPTNTYPYEVNVFVIETYDPEVYLMNEVRLISMSTLKEIK